MEQYKITHWWLRLEEDVWGNSYQNEEEPQKLLLYGIQDGEDFFASNEIIEEIVDLYQNENLYYFQTKGEKLYVAAGDDLAHERWWIGEVPDLSKISEKLKTNPDLCELIEDMQKKMENVKRNFEMPNSANSDPFAVGNNPFESNIFNASNNKRSLSAYSLEMFIQKERNGTKPVSQGEINSLFSGI